MNIGCSGDLGDLVYVLGMAASIPGRPHEILITPHPLSSLKTMDAVNKFIPLVKELAETQPYISQLRASEPGDKIDWNSGDFRAGGHHDPTHTLLQAHASHLKSVTGIDLPHAGMEPWITLLFEDRAEPMVVINRTSRYRNQYFPWRKIVEFYGDKLLFIGLPSEHAEFCQSYGSVQYVPTKNLLEAAMIIDSSALFIGNQSCMNAISEGLKHRSIQETSLQIPDCIFTRHNAQHVYDGACTLLGLHGGPDLKLDHHNIPPSEISTMTAPHGMWRYPGVDDPTPDFDHMVRLIGQLPDNRRPSGCPKEALIVHTMKRLPEWGMDNPDRLMIAKIALGNAQETRAAYLASRLSNHATGIPTA